jgi:hypothetical protein
VVANNLLFLIFSPGTTKHEETSWKAMKCVFDYFRSHEVDFKRPNKKSTSGTGKSGGRTNIAANLNNNDKIVKEVNQGSTPTLLALSESDCEQVTEGTQMSSNQKSDGMNSYLEDTQEKSENSEDTGKENAKETDKEGRTSDETCKSGSEQGEINPTTEAGDNASAEVKPSTKDQSIDATFISSTSSTPGEKTPNKKEASLKDNADTSSENPKQNGVPEDKEQPADHDDPGEAKEAKDVVGTSSGALTDEPNKNLNDKETAFSDTGDACKNAAEPEQKEIKTKIKTDEISDDVPGASTEQPNSESTGLIIDKQENNKEKATDGKSGNTSGLEPGRNDAVEPKDVKENDASGGTTTDKVFDKKSDDLHSSKQGDDGVDEKLKESEIKTTPESSSENSQDCSNGQKDKVPVTVI